MKNTMFVFLYLLFSCSQAYAGDQNYSIVFIHIGKEIPAYAETALFQARVFNKSCAMIFLANREALDKFSPHYQQLNVTYIACESLNKTADHENFLKKTSLDHDSREGFWLYTSERFLYLADLINQYELHNVFHLEYDNMLYTDLSELLPIFENQYKGIAATFDNDVRCIPGFVYIRNPESMNQLAKCFADHATENLNDMQILAVYKNENDENRVDHLPIITEEYVNEYPVVSTSGHEVENKTKYFQNIDLFHSIFDAAALGQFLGGIDPRNGASEPGFINESCIFNPSLLDIQWIPDDQNRLVPYVVYPHAKFKINNLHIHSKNLGDFLSEKG